MTTARPMIATVVPRSTRPSHTSPVQLCLFNAAGDPLTVPKQVEAQADVVALTQAAITGGEAPTEAEFNALRTDHAATRTVLNSLLAKLRTAGILAE